MTKQPYSITINPIDKARKRILDSGSSYMLVFITKGACQVKTESDSNHISSNIVESINARNINTEDVLILKPESKCTLIFSPGRLPFEYIAISASPAFLNAISDDDTDVELAFNVRPNSVAISHINSKNAMLIKNIAHKIYDNNEAPKEFGHSLFERNLYSILILHTLRSCIESDEIVKRRRTKKLMLDDIFAYISNHLTEDLSLDTLAEEFYVSKYYICHEFKKQTNLTPHAYIVKTRLSLCCKYIEQGIPINEVYQLGGFGDYNHFFRAFKKEYGMTPKEYYSVSSNSGQISISKNAKNTITSK